MLVKFDQCSRTVAIEALFVSQVEPLKDDGWTLIVMQNGREYSVNEPFPAVIEKLQNATSK